MKKSYKLLGVEWDHKDYETPNIVEVSSVGRDYKIDRDMFDLFHYVRSIKISEIMEGTIEQLDLALNKMTWCDEVQLIVENEPKVVTEVVKMFYYKRIGQIYSHVSKCLKGIRISLVRSA